MPGVDDLPPQGETQRSAVQPEPPLAPPRHGSTWGDQWNRIYRWRERVRSSRDDFRDDGLSTEHYRDELFALYQAIWHLKDWLRNDGGISAESRNGIEAWIESNGHALRVAADVANGSKHLTLRSGGARAAESHHTRNDVHVVVGVGVQTKFWITDARTTEDCEAIEFADRCLGEWRTYLAERGLTPDD